MKYLFITLVLLFVSCGDLTTDTTDTKEIQQEDTQHYLSDYNTAVNDNWCIDTISSICREATQYDPSSQRTVCYNELNRLTCNILEEFETREGVVATMDKAVCKFEIRECDKYYIQKYYYKEIK